MSTGSHIEVSNETRHKLECFKRVVDVILEEELTFEEYVDLVLSRGIKAMIRDVLPSDVEILLNTMEQFFEEFPDSTSNFMADTLKRGEEIQLRKRWFEETGE